jgi:hypothetical protein
MKLSDAEKKMVARLRRRKESFARWRWLRLFTSLFCIGAGIYFFLMLLKCMRPEINLIFIAMMILPLAYLFLWVGAWLMTDTLINWNGKPEVDLLLKLIEESQNDPNKQMIEK